MNVLIQGRRREGKSTLAMFLARGKGQAVIVFDPNAQFGNLTVVTCIDELEDAIANGVHEIAYQPQGKDIWQDFTEFAETIWRFGDYTLIVDEAHNLQSPSRLHPWLSKIIRQAPTDADPQTVHVIQTFHRPVDTNCLSRSQATHVYSFRLTQKDDLEMCAKEWGDGFPAAISTLEKGKHQLVLHRVDDEESEIWRDSSVWYQAIRGGAVTERK